MKPTSKHQSSASPQAAFQHSQFVPVSKPKARPSKAGKKKY